MLVRESENTVDNISVGEREDPSIQQSPSRGSTSKKDDLMISSLSDIQNEMQVTHKLLAQMVSQGNASPEGSASETDGPFGGKRTAMMLEAAIPDHTYANKRRKRTHIASEKAPKSASEKAPKLASEKAIDNASKEAMDVVSDDEVQLQAKDESNIIEDDILSVHAGVDELFEHDALASDELEVDEDPLAIINESLNPSDETGPPV